MNSALKVISTLAVAVMLTACGGGSGSNGTGDGKTVDPPPPPAANAAPTAAKLVEVTSLAVGQVTVSWLPASDDTTSVANLRYQVHASTDPAFTPSAATVRFEGASVASTTISSGWTPGIRFYVRVVALDAQGASSSSDAMSVIVSDTVATTNPGARITRLDASQVASVTPSSLLLASGASAPAVGQVVTSAEGSGFLRTVTSVSGSTVQTRNAALADVVSDVRIGSAISLSAIPTAAAIQAQTTTAAIQAVERNGRSEVRWPSSGLTLSAAIPPPADRTRVALSAPRGAGDIGARALATSGANIDVSSLKAEGGKGAFASLIAPHTAAIVANSTGTFTIDANIDQDDSGIRTGKRIPLALCGVKIESNPLPVAISIGSHQLPATTEPVSTANGVYDALRHGTYPVRLDMKDVAARSEPYILRLRLTVDTAENHCDGSLFGWKENIYVEVKIIVVSTPNFPKNESKALNFDGDFSVKNEISFTFDPVLETEFVISGASLKKGRVEAKGRAEVSQVLTISATKQGNLDKTANLIEERKFVKVFMAGPVPVILIGTFTVDMRVEGTVTGKLNATETLSYSLEDMLYGFTYENGEWKQNSNIRPSHSLRLFGEADAEAQLTVTLLPRLSLSLYESATARLVLAPYLFAEAGLHGKVLADLTDRNVTLDADWWIKKARISGGVDGYAMADFVLFDRTIKIWPLTAKADDYKTFTKLDGLAPMTPIAGIPSLSATVDMNAKHPTDSRAILIRGSAIDLPNPFYAKFGGPQAIVAFDHWGAVRVVAQNDVGYVVLEPPPGAKADEFWIRFTKIGRYTVRLGGYSTMGGWSRQIAEAEVLLTDSNGNGIPDQWEAKYGLTGTGGEIAAGDVDKDGISNLEEWRAGTNPTIASEPFAVMTGLLATESGQIKTLTTGATTADRRPSFVGKLLKPLPAGSVLQVFDNGVLLPDAPTFPTATEWSVKPGVDLAIGDHRLLVEVVDRDGSVVSLATPWPFSVGVRRWTITEIETPAGFQYFSQQCVLNSNDVFGFGQKKDPTGDYALYHLLKPDGSINSFSLPLIPRDPSRPFEGYQVSGINNFGQAAGQATGYFATTGTSPDNGAILWTDQTPVQLPYPANFSSGLRTTGINDSGNVIGAFFPDRTTGGFYIQGVLWSKGKAELLSMPTGSELAVPLAINNSNTIVGYANRVFGYQAAVWRGNKVRLLQDLDYPAEESAGGYYSYAVSVNESGIIVGTSRGRPVMWINDVPTEITDKEGIFSSPQRVNSRNEALSDMLGLFRNGAVYDLLQLTDAVKEGWERPRDGGSPHPHPGSLSSVCLNDSGVISGYLMRHRGTPQERVAGFRIREELSAK